MAELLLRRTGVNKVLREFTKPRYVTGDIDTVADLCVDGHTPRPVLRVAFHLRDGIEGTTHILLKEQIKKTVRPNGVVEFDDPRFKVEDDAGPSIKTGKTTPRVFVKVGHAEHFLDETGC